MTSWNLLPWQLKASCKAINTDSTATTNASSSYYHLNINYNPTEEIVQLDFVPPTKQTQREIVDKTEDKTDIINKCSAKANKICGEDMFKPASTINDTLNKSIQVPSTSLNNEKQRKHSRKRQSPSFFEQPLFVTDSINTNTAYESNDLTNQKKDSTPKGDTDICKLDRKKKHRHRRKRSQETITVTDTFSVDHSKDQAKFSRNEPNRERSEPSHTATVSENVSKENYRDHTTISRDASKKHQHHRECSEETLTITGTFSKSNFKDNIKVSKITKEEILVNKEKAKEICTKKKLKRKKDKVVTDIYQPEKLQNIIANFETVPCNNAQIYYVNSVPQSPPEIFSALRTKSKNSLIKHAVHKSKKKRKPHLSLETKCKDVQNTTSSSSGKCKSRESCASGKETLPVDNKKEGIKFFFIRNRKNIKSGHQKKTCTSTGSKNSGEATKHKHETKGKNHVGSNHLVETENLSNEKAKKIVGIQQNEVTISSKNKIRSQSVDAKTFKKLVDRDSVETSHCAGDAAVKLNKKFKTIRCSSQEKSDKKLETQNIYSKRQSKSETNLKKHKEIDILMQKETKEDLVGEQKSKTAKKVSAKEKGRNYKKNLKVENKTSVAELQKNDVKVEFSVLDKIFFKRNKNKNKDKQTHAVTEPRSVKKSNDSAKNEKLKNKSENKTKTQGCRENVNVTNSTDIPVSRECEKVHGNGKKRKRSKNGTEVLHSVDRKSSKGKVIESRGTADGVLDKKHKKSRKLGKNGHRYTTTEEVTPKSSEEIQKKDVPSMVSKEVHRKSRRRKEKDNIRGDNTSKSTLRTEQDQTLSVTDNSAVVYQLTNAVTGKREHERSKSDNKKIIKISKEQLEAIINQINKKNNLQQSKTLHYKLPSNEDKTTEQKETRKEVSFSQLNLKPVAAYYTSPMTNLNAFNGKQFDSITDSALSVTSREKKQAKSKRKIKVPDQKSVVSEAITKKEKFQYVCGRRYSTNRAARNFAYSENIFERSKKALGENDSSTVGFTVEGVEPPKMLKPSVVPSCLLKQYSNVQRDLRVAVVSVVNIQPNYEGAMDYAGRREIRRSLSLLNATADGDFPESRGLSDASVMQQPSLSVPHAQTLTSILSVASRKESRKSSSSHLESNTQMVFHTTADISLNEKADGSVHEIGSRSKRCHMQGNHKLFEEDELDKEQLAALGQEVFNRMKQYLKERYKFSKEECGKNEQEVQSRRKFVGKEQAPTSDQSVRSRMNKFTQDLNEKRRKSSRGSSASSRKSVTSTKDMPMEKKDTKTMLSSANTEETNKRRSLSRNSSNNSVSPRSTTPKIHLNTPVRDRSSSRFKRNESASRKEESTDRKSIESKNYATRDKISKVTIASRESSLESRRSHSPRRSTNTSLDDPLSSPKRKRSTSEKTSALNRKGIQSKDSIVTKNNLTTTSRETSNESIISESNALNKNTHLSLRDRSTIQSKRKTSLSRKEVSTERKRLDSKNDKPTKIPRRVSKEDNRKSPNNNLSSDKEGSLDRKANHSNRNIHTDNNKNQRNRSSGSTSSEFSSTAKGDKNHSSKLQPAKDVRHMKLKTDADLKNPKKSNGTLQKSETFLCDSLSRELGKEINPALIEELNVDRSICSEDATPLAKITEETSSQNSLNVTYSHIPEKLYKNEKQSHPNKYLKEVNQSKSRQLKHESTQERKVDVREKDNKEIDEHLKYLSKEMFDNVLGMLNLKSESTIKRRYHLPIPNYCDTQEIESPQDLQKKDFAERALQKDILNIKPYYEGEELQKSEIENITDKDQLIVINFSNSSIQTNKSLKDTKVKGNQGRAPEIKCSSCSINVHRDSFDSDAESCMGKHLDNDSSSLGFYDSKNKIIQFSKNSLENIAGKCRIGSCIPIGKSKIPLRKEGEIGKPINKHAEFERPINKKEKNEKSRPEENVRSVKIREKREGSIARGEETEKTTRNKEEGDLTIQKRSDVHVDDKSQKHTEENDRCGNCNTNECSKMIQDYIKAKQGITTYEEVSDVDNNTRTGDIKQKLNTGGIKDANKDLDDNEIQRLSNLVKQNVMKELQAANLLKLKALETQPKKQKQLDGIIERSIAAALNQSVYSVMVNDAVFKTVDISKSSTKTSFSSSSQQHIDTKSRIQDDISHQKCSEITITNQEKPQTSHNEVPETVMKSNLRIAQENKDSASQNTKKGENKNVAYSQNANSRKANNQNCSSKSKDSQMAVKCRQDESDKQRNIEDKKEAIFEKLTAMISSEPDFLYLESRLDKLLGIQHELPLKTANNVDNNAESVVSHNFENSDEINEVGNPVLMHAQYSKNPFNYKKANQVAYTVPAKKCKLRKSRLRVNSSHEMNTKRKNTSDITISNTSKTHISSKQSITNANTFEPTTTSESCKKEIKSNTRSQNISKIPTLIKPVTSATAKCVSKLTTSDTSETCSFKTKRRNSTDKSCDSVKETTKENVLVESTGDLEEPNSARFLTKLLDIELVEQSENQVHASSSSSKLPNTLPKAKTSSSLNTKPGRPLSAYEKRKLYGESLRLKKINSKNEPALTSSTEPEKGIIEDCIYCYPQHVRVVSTERGLQKQSKEASPSRPAKFSSRHDETFPIRKTEPKQTPSDNYDYRLRGVMEDRQDSDTDLQKLGCFLCTKMHCNPKNCTSEADDDNLKMLSQPFKNKRSNKYSTVPTITKPSCSRQNFQQKSASEERAKQKEHEGPIYQAYSVVADHPNVTDVFRNKFKTESSISLFSRESTFSCDNISPCASPRSFASNCSLNTFRSRTVYNTKSSSLLNTNYSDDIHKPYEETKRLNSGRRIVRGYRKKNYTGKNTFNMAICNPSKEIFSTIEQNLSDNFNEHKKMSTNSPLNLTPSFEFFHSTPEYVHGEVKNIESAKENIPFYSRSARMPRRKVSLLEACQHLRNSDHRCYEYVKTHTYRKPEEEEEEPDKYKVYEKIKEVAENKSLQENEYKNVNRKTFFKDTKSLIYQSLERTSKTLGSSSRKTSSVPYSNLLNQHHRENMVMHSNGSGYDLPVPYIEVKNVFEKRDQNNYSNNKNKTKKVNDAQNIAAPVRKTATVNTVKTTKDNRNQNRNVKLYSLRDLHYNANKSKGLKRRRYDTHKVKAGDGEQHAGMKIPSLSRFGERFFSKHNKRYCEDDEYMLSGAKDEEESYTIFKLDNDFQIHKKHRKSLHKNQSEECFKIFAYNNIIELDMECPPAYSTCKNKKYMKNPFLFSNTEKMKLVPQTRRYKKERLKNTHKKRDTLFTIPVTPTSEKTESGYGSCKSKDSRSLRKFFSQQQNVLDTFTSTFRCFDQEVYVSKSNPLSRVTTFPVNTSTYSKTCIRPQSESCPTDHENQPSISQRQRRTVINDSTVDSDCSDSPDEPYKYNQLSPSKFKSNHSNRHDRPVSHLFNIGIESSDHYCVQQEPLDDINNQNKKSRTTRYDERDSVKFEVDMEQPSSSNKDCKPLIPNSYSNKRHEELKSKRYKSRIPQKLKPRVSQYHNEHDELDERFYPVRDKPNSGLFPKQKLNKKYEHKENQNTGSSNRFNLDEEQATYSNYRQTLPTSTKYKLYEKYEYKEPEVFKIAPPQRQLSDVCQTDSSESVEEAEERYRGCSKQSYFWQSDSKEPVQVHRYGGRFKELIRSISRPFQISRKSNEDDQSSSYTVSTKDSELNQKYFMFKNYKNRNVNSEITSKSSKTSAVGRSKTPGQTQNIKCLQKQVDQCHEYANKVCTESRLRQQGHLKQLIDFKEIPLSILLGKNTPRPTESVKTNSNFSKKTNRSKKVQPKLKVLDDTDRSKEVFELKNLCKDKQDEMLKCSKFKKIYFHDESIENLEDVKISKSKPFNKAGVYTEETCKKLRNLLENSECTKETCEGLRNLLRKSEHTKETCNDLRSALKESECTEEPCKNLRKLLQELRETLLEGTEGTSVNLKNLSKESILPLKELLDMGFQKLLDVPAECQSSNELSTELMRLPSDTSSEQSSQHSIKELLDLPYQESTQTTNEDSIVPLKELLDRVFDELLSTASKNSSGSSKLSTHFIKSPFQGPSHAPFEKPSEFSPSKCTIANAFTESANLPAIKLTRSPGTTSLAKSAQRSTDITNNNQTRFSRPTESLVVSPNEVFKQSAVSQIEQLLQELSRQTPENWFGSFKERLDDTPLKEVQLNVFKSSPKESLKESIADVCPGYTESAFTNLKHLSKESKELLQLALQKILNRSKESLNTLSTEIHTLPTEIRSKESSKHSVKKPIQFSPSRGKEIPPKDVRKLSNKSLGASSNEVPKVPVISSLNDSKDNPYSHSAKTSSKGLKCLSKESKEILDDIFQKLLTLSKESKVGASLKNIIALPTEVLLTNPRKCLLTGIPELSLSEYSETSGNTIRHSKESDKMPPKPKETLLHVIKSPRESPTDYSKTPDESLRSLFMESKETFEEQFKQESGSGLSRNISSPTEILLKELLQYYVEVPPNRPFSECIKCATTPNNDLKKYSNEHDASSKEMPIGFKSPSEPTEEHSLKESLEHSFQESQQYSLSCACKYLRSILKEPLSTAPKEAVLQILKSLAENLSKESKEALYPNIENLFKGTRLEEAKSPLVAEPSDKGLEEPLDLSIKEGSLQSSKSPESVALSPETALKRPPKHSGEKHPLSGCTKATCKKLKSIAKQSPDALPKEVSVQVLKPHSETSLKESTEESSSQIISKSFQEPLPPSSSEYTKPTCKRCLTKGPKISVDLDSEKDAFKNLPEKSKEMLEEVFQKLTNLSEEAVSSKEMLEGVLSLSEEIRTSKEEKTLKESSQDFVEKPSNVPLAGCTKMTCKNLKRFSSKEVSTQVVGSESPKHTPSSEITPVPTILKSPSEISLKKESRHTIGTSLEAPPLQCTRSTCTNFKKLPEESADPSTKEVSSQVVKSLSNASLKGTVTESLTNSINSRSLTEHSKELLEEMFRKLSTEPSKETLEEAVVKLLSISNEMVASEEVTGVPESTNSTCIYRTKLSKATDNLPSKEISLQTLESPTTSVKEIVAADLETLLKEAQTMLEEIPIKDSSKQPELPLSGCTNSTCKKRRKVSKATGILPPKEISVQASESPSIKESIKNTLDPAKLSVESNEILEEKISLKKLSKHSVEVPSELPLSRCTKSTCTQRTKVSKATDIFPSKEMSVQALESPPIKQSIQDTLDQESNGILEEEISLKNVSNDSVKIPPELPLSGCTKATCTYLRGVSKTTGDSKTLKSPSIISSKESVKDISDATTSVKSVSKEEVLLKESSEPVCMKCAKSRCKSLGKVSKTADDLLSKEESVQVPDTSNIASQSLTSLQIDSKEILEAVPLKAPSEYSVTTPPKEEASACTQNTCQYLRYLPKQSIELLEYTLQNLISISKQSSKNSLSVLLEDPPELTESLPEDISYKPAQNVGKETEELPSSACTCGNNLRASGEKSEVMEKLSETTSKEIPECTCKEPSGSKCICNDLIDLSEESKKVSESSLPHSANALNVSVSVQSNEISLLMNSVQEIAKQPMHSVDSACSCKNITNLSDESKDLQETILKSSTNVIKQSSSVQSKDTSQIVETTTVVEPLQDIAEESLQSLDSRPYNNADSKKVSKESSELIESAVVNSDNTSKQSENQEPNESAQPMEVKLETTCSCENLISFNEQSRELLEITLQNSATTPQESVSKDPFQPVDNESLINNSIPECTCEDFARFSQESIELSNTIFQNLVKSSEQCMSVQINEQPHITESFVGTTSKGLFEDSAKASIEFSKYFFRNLEGFPKESKELLVAFYNILNPSKNPIIMLAERAPDKISPLQSKMCSAKCKESPSPATSEIPTTSKVPDTFKVSDASEVSEELFRQLCNVSLKTMMELYDKVSDDKAMKTSFKAMVEELCRNKLKREKLSDATQSQLNIIQLLQTFRRGNVMPNQSQSSCTCPQNKEKLEKQYTEEKKIIKTTTTIDAEKDKKQMAKQSTVKAEETPYSQENKISQDKVSEEGGTSTSKSIDGVSMKSEESFTDLAFSNAFGKEEDTGKNKENPLKKLRDSLTDKELFEKLLDSYEKEENIVERLSNDDEFFHSQLELVKSKESIKSLESLLKSKTTRKSEEKLLATLNLGSFSELDRDEEKRKYSPAPSVKTIESIEVTEKRPSKSKVSGLKSRVARLFKSESGVKEIVAPRQDGNKNSVDLSYLGKRSESYSEMDEETQQIRKSISNDDQKVTFTGGQRFHEEKKLFSRDSKSYLKEVGKASAQRTSSDSDSNIVKPTELGKCFLRGFRSDYVSLGGDTCLLISNQEKEHAMQQGHTGESYIEFSERDTPLEYLLALGFSIDEASNAIKDEDVKNRLFAAITEARIWINQISTVQGTLLYLIAYKAKPRIMRYYLQLVEAIINRRIQNAVKLDAFLRVLEKVEDGDLTMVNIIGSDKFDDEENEEKIVKKQLQQLFITVYTTAENEATLKKKPLSKEAIILLRILAAKYRAGLHPHLELIARYIGQGLLRNEVQLEAAMIYLSRLDTADVDLNEFEQYCGIVCKEKKTPASGTKAT